MPGYDYKLFFLFIRSSSSKVLDFQIFWSQSCVNVYLMFYRASIFSSGKVGPGRNLHYVRSFFIVFFCCRFWVFLKKGKSRKAQPAVSFFFMLTGTFSYVGGTFQYISWIGGWTSSWKIFQVEGSDLGSR